MAFIASKQRPDSVEPYLMVATRVLPVVLFLSLGTTLGVFTWLQAMPIA